MDEEKKQLSDPPRSRYKLYKVMTLTVLFLALFLSLGAIGLEATSSSTFCSSCHEMKPEYYTWKASSHSEVDCVTCHTESGVKETAKDKADLIVKAVKKDYNETAAPIRMPEEIPDSACEKCHNVFQRNFTVSGDIIIPHDKHKDEDVKCIECHNGVAHGEIADRDMTFKTDYAKWDSKLGKTAMAELKFTRPDMDTCIECHKARKITTECSACHTTGMVPENHKTDKFSSTHGNEAELDLANCNQCHKDMSTVKLEGYEEPSALSKYMNQDSMDQKKNHIDYAKENTFCINCHSERPATHDVKFVTNHGTLANENQELCITCHDLKKTSTGNNNQVYCSSCHPSKHSQNKTWRERHPIPISNNQKFSESCYKCHVKKSCSSCHTTSMEN